MSYAECTSHCHSRRHASDLIAVVTSSASEEQIKAYIKSHCHRGGQVCDAISRTVLHIAASCGKVEVLEWLLVEAKADKQVKDAESGWTALHRSIFYGQLHCTVKLIQFGCSLKSTDFEDLTPIEVAVKDKLPHIDHSPDNPCDVYTWGTNSNFTLGHSNQQSRATPDVVDELIRKKVSIKQVCINKFHSVFLATSGRVFTCGHGQGGRLGHGAEETCLRPSLVQGLTGTCVSIAAARDHTLFQMEDGCVYGCGENKFCQLGISSEQEHYLKPKQIIDRFFFDGKDLTMVASKFHSVFYTKDQVFTCGLNAGQLGHAKDSKLVSTPKLVTTLNHTGMAICQVAASDGVTACRTENGDVYLLQNYICRKIVNKQLSINKMVVIGGTLDDGVGEIVSTQKKRAPIVIVLLHKSGRLLSWQSGDGTLRRCVTNRKRQIFYTDVALSEQGLLLATTEGEAFKGYFTQKKAASLYDSSKINSESAARQGFIQIGGVERVDREKSELINIQRVSCLHRVTKVACDPKGLNFAALQNNPRLGLTALPEVGACQLSEDLKRLYSEGMTADTIHDVEITIGLQRFPGHKLILAHRSEYFRKLLLKNASGTQDDEASLPISHLNRSVVSIDMSKMLDADALKRALTYIYTNNCDVFDWDFVENVMNRERAVLSRSNSQNISGNNQKGKSKGGKKKKKKNTIDEGGLQGCEPEYLPVMQRVKEIKDSAKTLGIPSLFSRLELVKMRGSRLENFRPVEEQLGFNRSKYEVLSDITLESEDGVLFRCHRCILVARLEYFNSMLASGWLEASSKAPLQLPIPGDILGILLDFVYTAKAPSLDRCSDMELVCSVLVTADQLLLPRLKEITETILVDMISLRNVSQLLEFASMYQAPQLKAACHQFIGVNIVYLLESQSLDSLSDDVMVELTKAYREMVPGMSGRVITPYSSAPTPDELALLLEESIPVNMEEVITSAKTRRKERRKSSVSQSSETERRLSESIGDESKGPSEPSLSEEVISNAKARRKARRKSSEKFSRSSETGDRRVSETLSEEGDVQQTAGPGGDTREVYEVKGLKSALRGVEENARQTRLVDKFEANRDKWMKVRKPGGKKPSPGCGMDAAVSQERGMASGSPGHSQRSIDDPASANSGGNAGSGHDGPICNGGERLTNGAAAEISWHVSRGQLSQQNKPLAGNLQTTEQLPGEGQWLKKGQKVTAVNKPAKTPAHKPLQISVPPWQSSPVALTPGAGLKDIMAAEMAMMSSTPKKISPAPRKRPQNQSSGDIRGKPETAAISKPSWGGWKKPVSPPLPEEGAGYSPVGDDSLSSRKISFGDMLDLRKPSQHSVKSQNSSSTTSPVSPRSPNQSSVWGVAESSPRAAEPKSLSFTQIIQAEEQAEKNLDKALNKSLQSIQIEEQAMDELLQAYRLSANNEEYITVEQVKVKLANPQWSKTVT